MNLHLSYMDTHKDGRELKETILPGAQSVPEVGEILDITINDTREGCVVLGLSVKLRVDIRSYHFTLTHSIYGTSVETDVHCVCSLV
jgi:hypothetical protein